jgi:hypothetical protein
MKRRLIVGLVAGALAAGSGLWYMAEAPAASAATSFTAKADLNGRDGPSLDANVVKVDMYRAGEPVAVRCQQTGDMAYGTAIWDQTTENVWVNDAYVKTGVDGFAPGVPRCPTASATPGRFGFKATTALAGRSARATTASEVKTYPAGSTVYVTCQAIGANAYGSNIWDKTVDKLWVADHYLKTGYDEFTPGVPRCPESSVTTTPSNGVEYPAKVDLAGRKSKSTTAAEVKTYPAGTKVRIVCQAYGALAYGSYIWDRTTT